MVKLLGEGSYGKVYLVREAESQQLYALKTVEKASIKSSKEVQRALNERRILEQVSSPFTVGLHYSF
jgi:serine/threonine protein kinase